MGLKIGNNSANLERDCDHAPADFGVLFCFFGQLHPDQSILSEKEDWASVSQNRILHQQTKMVIQHDTIQEHPNASLWISWKTPIVEFWTKTDSETTPDSETRDSETARRIQKINVVFRNYFVGFRNYFVGFRNYSWYSETISWYSETISWYSETTRGIQKLFVVFRNYCRRIQKLLVVFRNYFRSIQKLFRRIQKLLVVFRNYFCSIQKLFSSDSMLTDSMVSPSNDYGIPATIQNRHPPSGQYDA